MKILLKILSVVSIIALALILSIMPCFANPAGGSQFGEKAGLRSITVQHVGDGTIEGENVYTALTWAFNASDGPDVYVSNAQDIEIDGDWNEWQLEAMYSQVSYNDPANGCGMSIDYSGYARSIIFTYDDCAINYGNFGTCLNRIYYTQGWVDQAGYSFTFQAHVWLPYLDAGNESVMYRKYLFVSSFAQQAFTQELDSFNLLTFNGMHNCTVVVPSEGRSIELSRLGGSVESYLNELVALELNGQLRDYPIYMTYMNDSFAGTDLSDNGIHAPDITTYSEYYDSVVPELIEIPVTYRTFNPLDFVFSTIGGVLGITIFGSLQIGHLLIAVIAIPLLVSFLKVFAGG